MSDDKTFYIMLQWSEFGKDIIFERFGAQKKKHHFFGKIFLTPTKKVVFDTKKDKKSVKIKRNVVTFFLENIFNSFFQQNNGNVK